MPQILFSCEVNESCRPSLSSQPVEFLCVQFRCMAHLLAQQLVRAEQKSGKNSHRVPSLWQLDESGISARDDAGIGLPYNEGADMKNIRTKPANHLSGIAHLCVEKALIGKTVYKNPNRPHPSPPPGLVFASSRRTRQF